MRDAAAPAPAPASRRESGFTLIEMIVVTLLLAIAMLGLLAVFDASARINKNENDVADAQGAVRYGIYQMTRVIRMAGSGGLFITQAVLNHNDPGLPGILPAGATNFNNVNGVSFTDQAGNQVRAKDGTDMIEVRGVILSPLVGFDLQTGCNGCTGSQSLNARPIIGDTIIGEHVNNDASNRPQFAAIDAHGTATGTDPMFVLVSDGNTDLHTGCSDSNPGGVERYPQPLYNVGVITSATTLVSSNTFGAVDFGGTLGPRFNSEMPSLNSPQAASPIPKVRRAGIMDDIVFFIALKDDTADPQHLHPYLAQATRRGDHFIIENLADDVEDMQVAYGIDTNADNAVTRTCPTNANDLDPNFSTQAGCDEWRPNAVGETVPIDTDFQFQNPFNASHAGMPPAQHCPTLHGVMISLLAKARDSDPTYKGPAALGYKLMDSTATPVTPGTYRRRVQTLKINLRNYAFQG